MKIRIAVSPSFGGFNVPDGFESDRQGTEWRIDLAKYLEEHANTVATYMNEYDESIGGIQCFTEHDTSWVRSRLYTFKKEGRLHRIYTVAVDTNVPWVIDDYNGAESFSYLPNYVPIDNYGRHKIKRN